MNITSILTLAGAALLLMKSKNESSNKSSSEEDALEAAQAAYDNATESGVDLGADEMNLEDEEDGYYYANAEKNDISVFGLLRIGNLAGTLNRGNLSVYVKNDSTETSYLIRKITADVYVYNEHIGFKKELIKDVNVQLAPGQTIEIQLGNSECYMSSKNQRVKLRDAVKAKCGKKVLTSCRKVDLGNIGEIDVNLEWQPRNGAGTPIKSRYTGKPCDVRYIDEAFYS